MIILWLIIVYGCYRGYKYARKKGMSNGNIIFTAIAGVFVFILGLIKISNHNTKAARDRTPLYKCSACGREIRTHFAVPPESITGECIGTESRRHLWQRIEN